MKESKQSQLIYFHSRDMLLRIGTSDIVFFEGDGNYTDIVTSNKQKVCVTMNLSNTEKALAAQLGEQARMFMRIGKRFIVNMNYIFQIDMPKQRLILSDFNRFTYQLPISKEALKTVKNLLMRTKI